MEGNPKGLKYMFQVLHKRLLYNSGRWCPKLNALPFLWGGGSYVCSTSALISQNNIC